MINPYARHSHTCFRVNVPQNGDHVRLHCLDAAEAPLFTQNDRYLTGVVISPLAAHDSSLIEVASLAGAEKLVVPNTRLELVTAQDSARVSEIFKNGRNQARSGGISEHCCSMYIHTHHSVGIVLRLSVFGPRGNFSHQKGNALEKGKRWRAGNYACTSALMYCVTKCRSPEHLLCQQTQLAPDHAPVCSPLCFISP